MVFENRIAKVGKGKHCNLFVKNNNKLLIFLNANGVLKKELDTSNERYFLIPTNEIFFGEEIILLEDNFALVRTQNNLILENIK